MFSVLAINKCIEQFRIDWIKPKKILSAKLLQSFCAFAIVSNIGNTLSNCDILSRERTFLCTPTSFITPLCSRIRRSAIRSALNPLLSQNSTVERLKIRDFNVGLQRRINSPFNSSDTETSNFRSFRVSTAVLPFFVTSNFINSPVMTKTWIES